MNPRELLAHATGRIFVEGDFRGVGGLIGREGLLLTSAGILNRGLDRGMIEVTFYGDRPRRARIIDFAFSEELGLDYAILKIIEPFGDRKPLLIGTGKHDFGNVLVGGFAAYDDAHDRPTARQADTGAVIHTMMPAGAPVLDLETTDNAIIGIHSPFVRADISGLENPHLLCRSMRSSVHPACCGLTHLRRSTWKKFTTAEFPLQ